MKKTKFTQAEIDAENKAREDLAYSRIKDYITTQQKRFVGSCGYNAKRILSQCNPVWTTNKFIQNDKSNVRQYLAIPSQTLADMAGFYLRTSRQETKRRIPYQTIISRLEKDGIVHVIYGDRKTHRANIYALDVHNKKRLFELMKDDDMTDRTTVGKTSMKTVQQPQTKSTEIKTKSRFVTFIQMFLDAKYITLQKAQKLLSMTKYKDVKVRQDGGASIDDITKSVARKNYAELIKYMIANYQALEISDGLNFNRENDLIKLQNELNRI